MKRISIENFKGLKVEPEFKKIMDKHAKKCQKILFRTSPDSHRPNRKTPYKLGWTVDVNPQNNKYALQIWNKTNWQLTHLLENGHWITNHNKGLAWSAPRKHIRPAFNDIRGPYIHEMKKAKLNVDFK